MYKLSSKRLAIVQWALGYWVFVKDTNPNPDENYGANEEYYSSEVEGIKL